MCNFRLKAALTVLLLLLCGCSNNAQYEEQLEEMKAKCDSTAEDVGECYKRAEDDVKATRAFDRARRHQENSEDLIKYIAACRESPDGVLIFDCWSCSRSELNKMARAERDGMVYVPRGATRSDFQCVSRAELGAWMRRML